MKTLIIIITLLTIQITFGQIREYKEIDVHSKDNEYSIDSLDVFATYALEGLTYQIGWSIRKAEGIKMIVLSNEEKTLFKSEGQGDSYIFRPKFYQTNNMNDPTLLFAEIGTEYSWGNICYSIRNKEIKKLGYLDVAVRDTTLLENAKNVMPHTKIQTDGTTLTINFTADTVLYNPGGRMEKEYNGSSLKYVYSSDTMELVKIK